MIRLLTFVILGFTQVVFAQQSFNTSGGNSSGTNISVSYSIGQTFYHETSSAAAIISEGVQHPIEIYILSGNLYEENKIIQLFPNPTAEFLNLSLKRSLYDEWNYQIFNSEGKLVSAALIEGDFMQIDLGNFEQGIYYVIIFDKSNFKTSYKIIKK